MKRTDTALVIANASAVIPALIRDGGGNARFAYDEFFKAAINNPHTRRAYGRVVDGFLNWCSDNGLELQNDNARHRGRLHAKPLSETHSRLRSNTTLRLLGIDAKGSSHG